MSSVFNNAMDSVQIDSGLLIRGENNALEYSEEGVGESRVALFFALVRGCDAGRVVQLMDKCLQERTSDDQSSAVADLFVMTFQTRDCRGGKGERDLFYHMLLHLYKSFPNTVIRLLEFIREYGYFKDFFRILEIQQHTLDPLYDHFRTKVLDFIANQLIADESNLDANRPHLVSLCAKYAPREGKHFSKGTLSSIYKSIVEKLYPGSGSKQQSRKHYRQLIARLMGALDVTEVKMCSKRYREIDFSKVPSVCSKKFAKAFLNEKTGDHSELTIAEEEVGNRYPDDPDRVACRQNLRLAVANKTLKGSQLFPHEIVKTLFEARRLSSLEKEMLNVQWSDIKSKLCTELAGSGADKKSRAVNVGKLVPLSDVSGSMSGVPMIVSIALGILISEVNHPAFRDRVLTFHSSPSWVDLVGCSTISAKVDVLKHAPWGGSTDIQKAFDLIYRVAREHSLPAEDIPDLIIFSDMQFDECSNGLTTQLEKVRSMFHTLGVEISGTPYAAPRIIFWNLRGDTVGFPATAADENVQMLSGFSPSLLKHVLDGEELAVEDCDPSDQQAQSNRKPTPYQTLRKVLDDERYHPLRTVLGASTEGVLASYSFEAPVKASSDVVE